ncbi:MAG: beta-galactosidase [Candidatus Hydrogenedentes bacterium]|nr:beta-galactosidase [Candidatus Hydrogenedentota bacterium]
MLFSAIALSMLTVLAASPGPAPFSPGSPMVITAGNDVPWQVTSPEEARAAFETGGELRGGPENMQAHWDQYGALYADHGVTAFEPYVKWMLMEPKEGAWDPEFYDAQLAAYKAHGLKWVPFLIAGPAYATPPWFKESDESVFAVDLKTGAVTRDQSIWNPHLRPRVRAWLTRFFAHYDHDDMQAVLLGISGVFGEAIYTAGGNEWTQIWDGKYPQHRGWWCGDQFAKADFAKVMGAKYGDIASLNQAWKTAFESFDDVVPFVPDDSHATRARLDLVQWYMGAMTDYAEWWVATARELAPEVPILLCTGGGAYPDLGADMTAQSKMVARYGAGMRITNEASDYAANFFLTRIVGTACRQYGTYFGYEPAGAVDTHGIVARIYNAVASGAWELFHYDNPPQGERGAQYKRYLDLLRVREPVVEVGYFWSRTSADLNLQRGLAAAAHEVRDMVDVAFVDEQLIADGALAGLKVLIWASGPVTEPETADAVRQAVENGLTLLVPKGWEVASPEGNTLFPSPFTTGPGAPETEVIHIGEGAVIQSESTRPISVAPLLAALINAPAKFGVPGLSPEASLDARSDKVYTTVTTKDILLYNHGDTAQTVTTPASDIEVPPHTIVSVGR